MEHDAQHPIPPPLLRPGRQGRQGPGPAPRPAEGGAPRHEPARHAAGAWGRTWQWLTAAAVTACLLVLTFTRGGWVPLLSGVDLVIHEAGHVVTCWAPPLLCSPAGSVAQVAVPLALAAYFLRRKDDFAVIVLVAWAAESLHNVAVYVADAQLMLLPLVGDDGSGAGHDWHNILGEVGLLSSTDLVAAAVRVASIGLFALAFALAARGYLRAHRVPETGDHSSAA